jgi:hypothetical protein
VRAAGLRDRCPSRDAQAATTAPRVLVIARDTGGVRAIPLAD